MLDKMSQRTLLFVAALPSQTPFPGDRASECQAVFLCVRADSLKAKLKTPFYNLFSIAVSYQALFEFHKTLLKCRF